MFSSIKEKINVDKILFIFVLCGYLIYILPQSLIHVPYIDEYNAWNISSFLSVDEIFKLAKYEGHPILWYLILMPFAKLNIAYPYSMEIINWLFIFGAILILWRYSPFNSWIKLFISCSTPIAMYALYSRCYSLIILIIFTICTLYSKRLKHPYIYSLLLVILANIHVIGAIIAFSFGVIFAADMYKESKLQNFSKKEFLLSSLICVTGALILIFQFYGYHTPEYSEWHPLQIFKWLICNPLALVSGFIVYLSFFYLLKNDLRPLYFVTICNGLLFGLFIFCYCGGAWHHQFIYTSIICAMWIYLSENQELQLEKKFHVIFGIFCLMLVTIIPQNPEGNHTEYKDFFLKNTEIFQGKPLFFFTEKDKGMHYVLPYIRNLDDMKIYDKYGNDIKSFDAYKKLWYFHEPINWEKLTKIVKTGDTEAYIFTSVLGNYIDEYENLSEKYQSDYQVRNYNKKDLNITFYHYIFPIMIYKVEINK